MIMRMSSYSLPQRATHYSEGTALVSRFGPTPQQRGAALALLKTRNQLSILPGFQEAGISRKLEVHDLWNLTRIVLVPRVESARGPALSRAAVAPASGGVSTQGSGKRHWKGACAGAVRPHGRRRGRPQG